MDNCILYILWFVLYYLRYRIKGVNDLTYIEFNSTFPTDIDNYTLVHRGG